MTIRQFAALIGTGLAIAALIALSLPVTAEHDSVFGRLPQDCGSALSSRVDALGGEPLEACQDELATRRAWGWPLGVVGLVVLVGALVVRPGQVGVRTRETGPSEHDSEGPVVQ